MKDKLSSVFSYLMIIAMALLLAVNYYVFIIRNNFAPAGINGIATMIQYKTGFSISYMSLLINIPLCIISFFLIERKYAYRSLVFTLVYSFSYLYLQKYGTEFIQYNADGHDTIFPAIISGVISGIVCGICLKHSSASGGMEFVSKYINKIRPETNFFVVTFVINAVVAVISLFVYSDKGYLDYKPVALCITYCFVTNFVGNYIIQGAKQAFKFTIITTHPDEICEEVTHILKHSATKLEAQGAYTGAEKTVLICVVNKHQLTTVQKLLKKYDNTFSFYETVGETYGNFKRIKQ